MISRRVTIAVLSLTMALLQSVLSFASERGNFTKEATFSDTIRVSSRYTSHVIFPTDLVYADISSSGDVAGKIIEQSRNIIALRAKHVFEDPISVSALESGGRMKTFIVVYDDNPEDLVIDTTKEDVSITVDSVKSSKRRRTDRTDSWTMHLPGRTPKDEGSTMKSTPTLREVTSLKRAIWHLYDRNGNIEASCTNILSYSDITYMVFNLRNNSGISYSCSDATFVLETSDRISRKRTVTYETTILPRSRFGSMSASPGSETTFGYSLDKLTLTKGQVLKVYFYENNGTRNLCLSIRADDLR